MRSPRGHETLTAVRVQELFTAEPAEGAENTQELSVLGGLRGEKALERHVRPFPHFLSRAEDQEKIFSISTRVTPELQWTAELTRHEDTRTVIGFDA